MRGWKISFQRKTCRFQVKSTFSLCYLDYSRVNQQKCGKPMVFPGKLSTHGWFSAFVCEFTQGQVTCLVESPLFAHESVQQLRILMRIQDWVKLAVVRARATDTCLDRRLMRASLMGYYMLLQGDFLWFLHDSLWFYRVLWYEDIVQCCLVNKGVACWDQYNHNA